MYTSTCMFLTLSLYMIMHVLNNLIFRLSSIHVHVCPSVCLCMNIHVPVCTYVRMYVCVCVHGCVCAYICMCVCVCVRAYVCMYTYICMYWSHVRILYTCHRAWTPPLTKILDPHLGPPGCSSIHPLKIVNWSIKEIGCQ